MDDESIDNLLPVSINTFAVPNIPELVNAYHAYKTSTHTQNLFSERGRSVYAEVFIDNPRLGTLADLCIRVLSKTGNLNAALLTNDKNVQLCIEQTISESIDLNLPLEDCYKIDDMRYWRRYVLANTSDIRLDLMPIEDFNWKNKGIQMKFVEWVENKSVEYWSEEEVVKISELIKGYVDALHIKHLQSMKDTSYEQNFGSESESELSSELSELIEISSDEPSTEVESVDEEDQLRENTSFRIPSKMSLINFKEEQRRARRSRNQRRQALRDYQEMLKAKFAEKKRRHESMARRRALKKMEKPKIKLKKKAKGVFDIQVEPEPDDGQDLVPDKRNVEKLLNRHQKLTFPADNCHHIDLSFVRLFENLTSFTIEFLGPKLGLEYHRRHMNFSYDDITRLSRGIRNLPYLKIFRLRNSRMDTRKLEILTRSLKHLETIEEIDLGYDQLGDDCGYALASLFEFPNELKSLELEYNELGTNAMRELGNAIKMKQGNTIEYLGLAHNHLSNDGLTTLCLELCGTEHVKYLNLSAVDVGKSTIVDFVANTLIRIDTELRGLDMRAIPLGKKYGNEFVKALYTNHRILHCDIRGCGMDIEAEFETDLIERRNQYIAQNPYIGDNTKKHEDIEASLDEQRHPIMVKLENAIIAKEKCILKRPAAYQSSSSIEVEEIFSANDITTKWPSIVSVKHDEDEDDGTISGYSSLGSLEPKTPFSYDPNTFDETQFREHVSQPGPQNRFYYLRNRR